MSLPSESPQDAPPPDDGASGRWSTRGVVLGRNGEAGRESPVGFAGATRHLIRSPGDIAPLVVDDSDSHVALFAPTGAGKSRNLLVPVLLSTQSSVVALDVKGELTRTTARYRKNVLGQRVHVLDTWHCVTDEGDSFNHLDCLDPDDPGLADDAYAQAGMLIDPTGGLNEIYWDEGGQALNAGLITQVVTAKTETDRSMRRVWQLAHGDDTVYGLAKLLDDTKDMHPYAYAQIAAFLGVSADNTRSCLLSTLRQHIRLFGTELVGKAVATTSFDLDALREGEPTTIYIVIPPDKLHSHKALIRMWLSALMGLMTRRKSTPKTPTMLILDEVAQLGRMEQVTQAITLMRGYGLRCLLALQSHAQLKQLYPKEHEVLLENCGTVLTFGHTAFSMSRQMADVLGDISAETLFSMGPHELAVRRAGERTRRVTRLDYLTDPDFAGRADPNPMYAGRS